MAYNGAFLWTAATAADQTAYSGTDRLQTINNVVYLSFPMKHMAFQGYKSTPNVREEIKAYRDDNTRNLTRVTAQGTKTGISIDIIGGLHNAQKKDVIKWFTDHETDALQRKIPILYYDMDSDTYKTGNFYRSDTEYTVLYTTATDIVWNAFTIELAEY